MLFSAVLSNTCLEVKRNRESESYLFFIGKMYSTAYRKARQLPTAARGPSTAHRRPGVRPLLTEKAFICPQEKRLLFAYNSGPLHCPQRLPGRPRWSKNLPTVRRLPTAANHFVPASAHSPLSAHSGNGMWAGSAYYGNCPNACLQVCPEPAYKCLQAGPTHNGHCPNYQPATP